MLDSWEEYLFLCLVLSAFTFAFLSRDWRLQAGAFTALAAWTTSVLLRSFVPFISYLAAEVVINIVVFYVYVQLHYRVDENEREPIWPLVLICLEIFIFCSHIGYWFFGLKYYVALLNLLFGAELVILIFIGILHTIRRFFDRD